MAKMTQASLLKSISNSMGRYGINSIQFGSKSIKLDEPKQPQSIKVKNYNGGFLRLKKGDHVIPILVIKSEHRAFEEKSGIIEAVYKDPLTIRFKSTEPKSGGSTIQVEGDGWHREFKRI